MVPTFELNCFMAAVEYVNMYWLKPNENGRHIDFNFLYHSGFYLYIELLPRVLVQILPGILVISNRLMLRKVA